MPYIFSRVTGTSGRIDVSRLGVSIAEIASWTLTRRSDEGPDAAFFDFRCTLTRVTQGIFDDPEYEKRVIIQTKGRAYRLVQAPGERMALMGRSLVMERVVLEDA